ncbi:DUF6263 family protein [Ascidiimonas aurantiaca]|uniref:DUF6263 family protein n=1 Tax=Ascidiimonas aurantiaca TaxID=1685432 RepID=UPI0030EF80A9
MKFSRLGLLLLATSFFYAANAQVSLRYNLKKGDVFFVQQHVVQEIAQEIDSLDQTITSDVKGILKFSVQKVFQDTYELQVIFTDFNIHLYSNLMGDLVHFEALAETDEDTMYKPLLKYPLLITLQKNGTITEVKGCEELIEHMLQKASIEDEFTRELMRAALENEFGAKALSQSYEQMTYFYPDKDVKLNESWLTYSSGNFKAENTWKLTGLNPQTAMMQGYGKVNIHTHQNGVDMALNGEQKVWLKVNPYNGFLKELIIEGTAKGHSKFDENGAFKIPTTIKSRITYNLIQ